MAATIPDEVKKVVTFIFIEDKPNKKFVANGTGFFVSIKDDKNPDIIYVYLVTAKHVLSNENGQLYENVFVRLNKITNGSEFERIPLKGQQAVKVYYHEDETVDIAVIRVPDLTFDYDYKVISQDLITTSSVFRESKIREGDDVFFIGLFTPYFGNQKNYPITRFGKVALITDEKIPWRDNAHEEIKLLNLYLIEIQSFGGNSGSPVFFNLDPTREPGSIVIGPPKLLLGGVMIGTFLGGREVEIIETQKVPISRENVGIAAVVPAYKLHELLFSDELSKARKGNQ